MPRAYRQLDLAERRTIFRLLDAKTPVAVIARKLGRHRSTIHREIRRNHFHGPREYAGYYGRLHTHRIIQCSFTCGSVRRVSVRASVSSITLDQPCSAR